MFPPWSLKDVARAGSSALDRLGRSAADSILRASDHRGEVGALKQANIPRIPGWLGVIFRFIGAARNEIRSQPPSLQPNRRVARIARLQPVALRSSRRTSPVAVCLI